MGMRGPFPLSCLLTPPDSGLTFPNPNPARFKILLAEQIGSAVVAEIYYPDCNNYEGRKIVVFSNTTKSALMQRKTLDPHFTEHGGPIARLEPTVRGWKIALEIARMLKTI